jgi:hypothetical protein
LPAGHAAELGGRTHPIRFELHKTPARKPLAHLALDVPAGSTFYVPR